MIISSPALGKNASAPGLGKATAIGQPREVIVVLGMHRSGTSLCMSVLDALGVRVDNEHALDVHNPRGYFEANEIVRLNEKLLRCAGSNWFTFLAPALQGTGRENTAPDALKQRLSSLIRQKVNLDPTPWALKDPRLCLLLPLYERVFEQCNLSPAYVLCIRDPRSVARSLKKRDHFPEIFSELLWLNHTMGAMRFAGERIKAVVHYEKWFQDGTGQMLSLAAGLGLQIDRLRTSATTSLEAVVDPSLNHHGDVNFGRFALPGVDKIYRLLLVEDYEGASRAFLEFQRRLYGERRAGEYWRAKEGELEAEPLAGSDSPLAPGYDLAENLATALEASLAEITQLRQSLQAAGEWRSSVLRSWSWRLTAPVRRIGSLFLR